MAGHDVFLSHASEDKASVARPLAQALETRGWSVWLDELELQIGDSLHGHLDRALSRSRFGVVVLSQAFLDKRWTQRELAALAAREVSTGDKVILPVWHEITHEELAARSPLMADRLGASTSAGIGAVADRLSRALTAAMSATSSAGSTRLVQPVPPVITDSGAPLVLPLTPDARAAVASMRPSYWEHILFAGHLTSGGNALEGKWYDHELRQGRGERRVVTRDTIGELLEAEMDWIARQVAALDRAMNPEATTRAFGAPGEPGDPLRIEHLAQSILRIYESLMDWAASLRNVVAPSVFEELIEATAAYSDGPCIGTRSFIAETARQISEIPVLLMTAPERPLAITLTLDVGPLDGASARIRKAARRAKRDLARGR
jgi:hypothetical protein